MDWQNLVLRTMVETFIYFESVLQSFPRTDSRRRKEPNSSVPFRHGHILILERNGSLEVLVSNKPSIELFIGVVCCNTLVDHGSIAFRNLYICVVSLRRRSILGFRAGNFELSVWISVGGCLHQSILNATTNTTWSYIWYDRGLYSWGRCFDYTARTRGVQIPPVRLWWQLRSLSLLGRKMPNPPQSPTTNQCIRDERDDENGHEEKRYACGHLIAIKEENWERNGTAEW